MNIIKTSNTEDIKPFLKKIYIAPKDSHKGQNGKILVVGGSGLFHAASIWAAETASYFVDMVHYSSTKENNEIVLSLKKKFMNGIVVAQKDMNTYITEDDVVLMGPGMARGDSKEGKFTAKMTQDLLKNFPDKRVVLDAGALQALNPDWLTGRGAPAILTPHQKEFKAAFKIDLTDKSDEEKTQIIKETAKKYKVVILLKTIYDIVSDGTTTYRVEGGNPGLTRGGSGDVLAALTASLYAKSDPVTAAVVASYVIKKTAERLSITSGYWYNTSKIVQAIPETLHDIIKSA